MVKIPRFQQTEILKPEAEPSVAGFQAVANLFGKVTQEAGRLNEEQIQAEKVIGSNQMQTSYKKLQTDAEIKFPNQFDKQAEFINGGAKQYEEGYIPNTNFANRGYFKALSKNYLSNVNFTLQKQRAVQQLKEQRVLIQNQADQAITNTSLAIRQGNDSLARDNMGQFTIFLNDNVKSGAISPATAEKNKQRYLLETNLAGAKRQMDVALTEGGPKALDAKFREIATDAKNPLLSGPQGKSFISQLNSYRNASTAGLKASQTANKSKISAILNNARLTGQISPQDIAQFEIPQSKVNQQLTAHDDALNIWTKGPVERQNEISALNQADPAQALTLKTFNDFNSAYKKDKMGFLLNMLGKMKLNVDVANMTPEQLQQTRAMAVQMQQQRGDSVVEPATNAEIQEVVGKTQEARVTQNPQLAVDAMNTFGQNIGKFQVTGTQQLTKQLTKNGMSSIIEDIGSIDEGLPNGKEVAENIVNTSLANPQDMRIAAAARTNVTVAKFDSNLRSQAAAEIGSSDRSKLIDSILNDNGSQQGAAIAEVSKNMEDYAAYAVANGKAANLDDAMKQYMTTYVDSFNYMPTRNGLQTRIPKTYRGLPVDSNFVAQRLKGVQSEVKFNNVDLSSVKVDPREGKVVSQARWWNSVGSLNHWIALPGGESYELVAADGKPLNDKKTKLPFKIHLESVIGEQPTATEQEATAKQKQQKIQQTGVLESPIFEAGKEALTTAASVVAGGG